MTVILKNVTKEYDDGFKAVDNIDLEIKKGEFIVLIGPSGCGKTTTLEMINRLIEPTSGKIYINGQDTSKMSPVKLRRNIGYVIQGTGLFPHFSIGHNISLLPRIKKWAKEKVNQRVEELLKMVGLDPEIYLNRVPKELSGGQRQRIGVLRALAAEPDIVLMDEPFGALDPITREQLQDELKRIQAKLYKTIVFVTHDMDEALKLADRIVIMQEGKIVQIGSPEEILRNPINDFVRSFLGKDRLLRNPNEVKVSEIMLKKPVTIWAKRGLAEAVEKMRKNHVDNLIVLDPEEHVLGIASAEDIQKQMKSNTIKKIGDACHTAYTISQDDTVLDAVEQMSQNNLRILAVTSCQDGPLVGLLTRSSFVDILAEKMWNILD